MFLFQLSDALKEVEHTTVKYDGTTKAKEHWVESQVGTKSHTYTIGLEKTAGGSAETYVKSIMDKVEEIGVFKIIFILWLS